MRAATSLSILLLCLSLVSGAAPGSLSSAAAQQQEKRIALVVGNGAYAKSPLATAANDAGLIAQTLQAAGFDVVGARDLDGDTLRKSFRDFMQKAEASGPDTVAMVYLAGYGMQLAGENYFIPVDSPIGRETDIPTEGLRIGRLSPSACGAAAESRHRRAGRRPAATVYRRWPADRGRPRSGRTRAAYVDRLQRRAGHRGAGRAGVIWRLRAIAGRDDPHRRLAAARTVRSRQAARQRSHQGRAGAVACAQARQQFRVLRSRARCAGAGSARSGRCDPKQADPRSRGAGRLRRSARTRHAAGLRGVRSGLSRRSPRETGAGVSCGAARGDHLATDLSRRHARGVLVVSAALPERAARCRRAPSPRHPDRRRRSRRRCSR